MPSSNERIAEMALECADLMRNRVDDPVDMVLVLSTMTATMCIALDRLKIGYCPASGACMAIDYILQTVKELTGTEPESKQDHGFMSRMGPGRRDV